MRKEAGELSAFLKMIKSARGKKVRDLKVFKVPIEDIFIDDILPT